MNDNEMGKNFQRGKIIKVTLHCIAWSILIGVPFYFIQRWQVDKDFIWLYYINTLISGLIFYINYLFLVPKFFFNRRKLKYYVSVLVLIASFYFISDLSNKLVFNYISDVSKTGQLRPGPETNQGPMPEGGEMNTAQPGPPPFRNMHHYNFMFTSFFLVFFSLGIKVLERQSEIEELQKETEKEKLNSELAFLKNQISPHFFFNTLNNIYSLVSINAEDSQKAIIKLSKLMRYLLYESEQGKTMLSSEIDFMNNYIDLMRLRMSEKVKLTVSFPGQYEDKNIPPLLFIPFIENSFKHGISYRGNSFIEIKMEVKGESITFICNNSISDSKESITDKKDKGIGLENVKKRLNLLFPGKHELTISKLEKEFRVFLGINIS